MTINNLAIDPRTVLVLYPSLDPKFSELLSWLAEQTSLDQVGAQPLSWHLQTHTSIDGPVVDGSVHCAGRSASVRLLANTRPDLVARANVLMWPASLSEGMNSIWTSPCTRHFSVNSRLSAVRLPNEYARVFRPDSAHKIMINNGPPNPFQIMNLVRCVFALALAYQTMEPDPTEDLLAVYRRLGLAPQPVTT